MTATGARTGAPVALVGGLVLMMAALLLAVGVATIGQDDDDAAEPRTSGRAAIEAYADALEPAARQAGKTILAGVRPDVVDFRAGKLAADVWISDMVSFAKEFGAAASVFATTKAPAAVGDAPAWFEKAFGAYADAVAVLKLAGTATGATREELIGLGTQLGDDGDRLYDQGAARIQEARRTLGLAPDPRFPGASQTNFER